MTFKQIAQPLAQLYIGRFNYNHPYTDSQPQAQLYSCANYNDTPYKRELTTQ